MNRPKDSHKRLLWADGGLAEALAPANPMVPPTYLARVTLADQRLRDWRRHRDRGVHVGG
jgi:hypothetical protein